MSEKIKDLLIKFVEDLPFEWFIGILGGLFILCLVLFLFILKLLMGKGQQDQTVKNLKEKVKDLNIKVSNAESKIASLDSQMDSLKKDSESLLRIIISQKNQSE
jgi:uncharacterized ion transporter superfamily protein YfcC